MSQLTEAQTEAFYERLLAAKDAVEALLYQKDRGDGRVEASGSTIGRLTRMDAIQLQAMSQLSRGQLSVRLQQIEAAVRAHGVGRYGACNRCKQPISLERLDALPEAPLCMDCQELVEHDSRGPR